MSEFLIKVKDVYKSFGSGNAQANVLQGVDLKVLRGDFVSIMGTSGCGKSTLLYLVGGLDAPQSGKITVCGKDILGLSDREKSVMRRRDIGFIFQFYNLVPNLSVEENILLPLIMDGQNVSAYRKKLTKTLARVGLSEKRNSLPSELSGGQQQRVAIARALITDPKVLLADEPTGNLDERSSKEIMELFSEVNRDLGITILQVTHSDAMAAYGNRTYILQEGKLVRKEGVASRAGVAGATKGTSATGIVQKGSAKGNVAIFLR